MYSQTSINYITSKVVQAAKESLGNKLDKVILYGSYARGDYSEESDVDVMVLANISREDRGLERGKIRQLLNCIDLEHDVVLTINVTDTETFNRFFLVEPFYQNVIKDGVVLGVG